MPRVTIASDGREHVFRAATIADIWLLRGQLPLDITEGEALDFNTSSDAVKLQLLDFVDRLLVRCSIHPKFTAESPIEIPSGTLPIEEIDPTVRLQLFADLMRASGMAPTSSESIAPLSEEGGSPP